MDGTSAPAFLSVRHRVSRQNLPPFKTEFDSPLAGPSRLSPLAGLKTPISDDRDDLDTTPRMTIRPSLPSPQTITPTVDNPTAATPQDRLRALIRGTPTPTPAGANQTTQLMDVRPPTISSGNDSDFEPPPRWSGSQVSASSVRIKNIFSDALRDTPRKPIARRNSVDASEVSDSPRVERVVHERSKNKGKRKSLSDDERAKLAAANETASSSSHAANIEALRNRILSSSMNKSSRALSDISLSDMELTGPADERGQRGEYTGDTASILRRLNQNSSMASHGVNGNATMASSARSLAFPQMANQTDLLEGGSEMRRALGDLDSSDAETSRRDHTPAPISALPELGARPRASLGRTESLTENKLSGNAARRASGSSFKRFSADVESIGSLSSGAQSPITPGSPHKDVHHYHRNSHSRTGSPMMEVRSRRGSMVSLKGIDNGLSSSSRGSSIGSEADFNERLNDPDRERKLERERAWNRPAAALHSKPSSHAERERTYSHPTRPSSALSSVSSRANTPDPEEHPPHPSRPRTSSKIPRRSISPIPPPGRSRTQSGGSMHISRPSSSLSVHSSRASTPDPEEEHIRERNWNSPRPQWSPPANAHHPRRSMSPLPPEPSPPARTRTRTQSGSTQPALSKPHPPLPNQRAEHPSRPTSSLSMHSSRASSPDPEGQHIREHNWNSPRPNWSRTPTHPRRSTSPMPPSSTSPHIRARTQSLGGARSSTPTSTPPAALQARSRASMSPETVRKPARSLLSQPGAKPSSTKSTSSIPKSASNSQSTPVPSSAGKHINGKTTIKPPGFTSGLNWKFPRKAKVELSPLEDDDDESGLESPPRVKPLSKLPVRSPGKVPKAERKVERESEENKIDQPLPPGHRRSRTEFMESKGAIPPKIVVQSEEEEEEEVRMSLDDDGEEDEEEEVRMSLDDDGEDDEEEEVRMSLEDNGEYSVRESDEDASGTPIMRPTPIPPVEDTPAAVNQETTIIETELRSEPEPEPEPVVEEEASSTEDVKPADSATPPISPPPTQPSFSDLITPPRRSAFSTPKLEQPTPSPSRGLPALPPPPPEDETDTEDFHAAPQTNFSLMKTPRPPGAWLATPAPPPRAPSEEPVADPGKTRARANSAGASSEHRTPASSLVRHHTLPSRTPAPPGAWVATPAANQGADAGPGPNTLHRKSVRFEPPPTSDESSVETSGPLPAPAFDDTLSILKMDGPEPTSFDHGLNGSASIEAPSFVGVVAESSPANARPGTQSTREARGETRGGDTKKPRTPEKTSFSPERERRVRKSPSVRLVDEYGRVRAEDRDEAERDDDERKAEAEGKEKARAARKAEAAKRDRGKGKEEPPKDLSVSLRMPGGSLRTPRSKSAVRMLDAMGREVEDEQNDSDVTVTDLKLTHAEKVVSLRRAFDGLNDQLPELERSTDTRAAREHDKKRYVESDVSRAQRSMLVRQAQEQGAGSQRLGWRRFMPTFSARGLSWLFWTIFLTQFFLALYMYRLSLHYAKEQFLTTYYDPFNGELHLYAVKPESSYTDPTEDDELLTNSFSVRCLHVLVKAFGLFRRHIWDTWGSGNRELARAWPPT